MKIDEKFEYVASSFKIESLKMSETSYENLNKIEFIRSIIHQIATHSEDDGDFIQYLVNIPLFAISNIEGLAADFLLEELSTGLNQIQKLIRARDAL
jgi:hypothetical protein